MQTTENATAENATALAEEVAELRAKLAAAKPGPKARVTDEMFARAWTLARSVEEAAEKLGMTGSSVRVRYKKLVAAGVKLRRLPPRSRVIDVDAINAMIEAL